MLVDYHMHTPLCKHATGTPLEYAAKALEAGLGEIGFSDHNPMPPWYDPGFRMTYSEYTGYLREIHRLQTELDGKLTVRLGLEADFFPGTEEFVRETIATAPLDYVIGSVHYIGDWAMDNPDFADEFSRRDITEVWRVYWDLVGRLGKTRLYDILGHADVVKKFGHRPAGNCDGMVKKALVSVRQAGMVMEVNTSGLRKPCREIYPSARILQIALSARLPITLGSDAHRPSEVAQDFDAALRLVKDVGYRSIWKFRDRKRTEVML